MKENLRVRVGAVVLALATLAAVTYGWLNFRQRSEFDLVDDGVAWSTVRQVSKHGAGSDSPAAGAGIRPVIFS